ncbi:MAG: hypothetical protein M3O50_05760 [Myxococcota bacterium]|nr:hypothetical protein [Myxococcota bacterium]
MSTTIGSSDAYADCREAEWLLSRLATDLLRLPFERRTRMLHVRALKLKRLVGQWGRAMPSDTERIATRQSILSLRREAAGWRELLR